MKRSTLWKDHKTTNSSLKTALKLCIEKKNLSLSLFKVKGHSGCTGNERADTLAKEGTSSELFLHLGNLLDSINLEFTHFFNRLNLVIKWGDHLVDNPIRSFISHQHKTKTEALWATAKYNRNVFHTNSASMNLWGASLEYIKGFRCLSWRKNSMWSFSIKLTNHLLPTLDILKQRYSSIYKNWNCPSCFEEQETIEHLFTCNALQIQWIHIKKCVEDYIGYFVELTDTRDKLQTACQLLNIGISCAGNIS